MVIVCFYPAPSSARTIVQKKSGQAGRYLSNARYGLKLSPHTRPWCVFQINKWLPNLDPEVKYGRRGQKLP